MDLKSGQGVEVSGPAFELIFRENRMFCTNYRHNGVRIKVCKQRCANNSMFVNQNVQIISNLKAVLISFLLNLLQQE